MIVKIKLKDLGIMPLKNEKGDMIDLAVCDGYYMSKGSYRLLDFGVVMELPKGMSAYIVPRSSTFRKYKILQANSVGVIDNSYCGDNDWWQFPAYAVDDTNIPVGSRIAQFAIRPNQNATLWQRIKYILSPKIKLKVVSYMKHTDRGGFGSTGD